MSFLAEPVETPITKRGRPSKDSEPKKMMIIVHRVAEQAKCLSCLKPGVKVFEISIVKGSRHHWHDWCRDCAQLYADLSQIEVVVGDETDSTAKESKQLRMQQLKKDWEEKVIAAPEKSVEKTTEVEQVPTKKRGRPKGSTNKPKTGAPKKSYAPRFTSMKRKR